jgi:pyridoxamine 5'-phosphate oxidase
MSLEDLRRQYTLGGLKEDDVPNQPLELFAEWMTSALDNAPADWIEPYAMTLATSTSIGEVSARIVLLRGYGEAGFMFYTSYESQKALQIEANSKCALVFYWGYLERQIRVSGSVSRVSREQSESYFHKRPRGSQISAVVSRQSQPIRSRDELEVAVHEFKKQIGDDTVPLPSNWGGYCVCPQEIEFWQGRKNRLHDRLVYSRVDASSANKASGDNAASHWATRRISP